MDFPSGCLSCCEGRRGEATITGENTERREETIFTPRSASERERKNFTKQLQSSIREGKLVVLLRSHTTAEQRQEYDMHWNKLQAALDISEAKYEFLSISPIWTDVYETQLETLYGYTGALPALFVGLEPISADEVDMMLKRGQLVSKFISAGVEFKSGASHQASTIEMQKNPTFDLHP